MDINNSQHTFIPAVTCQLYAQQCIFLSNILLIYFCEDKSLWIVQISFFLSFVYCPFFSLISIWVSFFLFSISFFYIWLQKSCLFEPCWGSANEATRAICLPRDNVGCHILIKLFSPNVISLIKKKSCFRYSTCFYHSFSFFFLRVLFQNFCLSEQACKNGSCIFKSVLSLLSLLYITFL